MELFIKPSAKYNHCGVLVKHRDQEIDFKGAGKVYCGMNDVNLFNCYNDYLDNLSMETQDDLFDCYEEAKMILDPTEDSNGVMPPEELLVNNKDYHFLVAKLKPIIDKIIKLINPANFEYYIQQNGLTVPPKDLDTHYNRGEFPKETTIDEISYQNIVRYVLVLRSIMPIISEMMVKAEEIAGKDYKEAVTGLLIKDNPYLMQHPGWKKIHEYVDYSYNAKHKTINQMRLEIITEDAYATHAIYRALFSRLCLSHIPSLDPQKNLAKGLFSIVLQFDQNNGQVKERPGSKDENAQKRSVYEIPQLKETVNSADEMAQAEYFSFGLFDANDVPKTKDRFKHQCEGLGIQNPQMVETLFDLIPDNWDFELGMHMVKLFQLVFAGQVSYNIVYALENPQLPAALALAQTKLHELGFPNLAILMTAIPDPDVTRTHTSEMFSLNGEERKAIEDLCDVVKTGKGEISTDNEAVASAIAFFKDLTLSGWSSTIEPGLIDDPKAMSTVIRGVLFEVELTKDIKDEFLSLIQLVNSDEY